MAVIPHSIDIVVADMAAAARFYRDLGLAVPAGAEEEQHVQIDTPGGATIGLMSETIIRAADPDWQTPIGQRVTFACRRDEAAEVGATFARMIEAGHRAERAPWDSPSGQRYAMLRDPDGIRVDLFAD